MPDGILSPLEFYDVGDEEVDGVVVVVDVDVVVLWVVKVLLA